MKRRTDQNHQHDNGIRTDGELTARSDDQIYQYENSIRTDGKPQTRIKDQNYLDDGSVRTDGKLRARLRIQNYQDDGSARAGDKPQTTVQDQSYRHDTGGAGGKPQTRLQHPRLAIDDVGSGNSVDVEDDDDDDGGTRTSGTNSNGPNKNGIKKSGTAGKPMKKLRATEDGNGLDMNFPMDPEVAAVVVEALFPDGIDIGKDLINDKCSVAAWVDAVSPKTTMKLLNKICRLNDVKIHATMSRATKLTRLIQCVTP